MHWIAALNWCCRWEDRVVVQSQRPDNLARRIHSPWIAPIPSSRTSPHKRLLALLLQRSPCRSRDLPIWPRVSCRCRSQCQRMGHLPDPDTKDTACIVSTLVSPKMLEVWSEQTIWLVILHKLIKANNLISLIHHNVKRFFINTGLPAYSDTG